MSDGYMMMRGANWSSLKWLRESPMMYRYRRDNPQPDKPVFALGRATHALVFEPETFERDFVIWEGGRRSGKGWEDFQAEHKGQTILRTEDVDGCTAMADAVRRHPLVQPYLDGGQFEVSMQWTDPNTGLACKGKPDWIIPARRILLDLKTSQTINGRAFGSDAARFGYHCQLAHYAQGCEHALGWKPSRVLLVAVEKDPPHDVGIFELDEETLWAGYAEVQSLLTILRACRESDHWPGRYDSEQALQLPAWMFAENDEDPAGFDLEIKE